MPLLGRTRASGRCGHFSSETLQGFGRYPKHRGERAACDSPTLVLASVGHPVARGLQERGRFDREIQRLLAYSVRGIVVESTWAALEAGGWRSQVTPAAAVGSCLGWIAAGVPIIMAGDHDRAG
jgi:hypothetical protein